MREIVASLFTVATLLGGYAAYKSNQPAKPAAQVQQFANADYAGLILPHLQAAFSPLDPNRGSLAEQPLIRMREYMTRDGDKIGAREAIQLVDQLFPILAEREAYQAKLNTGSSETSSAYFNERVLKDWLVRANVLAPPLQRGYAGLIALRDRSGQQVAQIPMGFEPYYEMGHRVTTRSALEQGSRPVSRVYGSATYVDQAGYASSTTTQQVVVQQPGTTNVVVVDPLRHDTRLDGPRGLEEHRSGLEEHRSPFDDHRVHVEEHHTAFETQHPVTTTQQRPITNQPKPPVVVNRPPPVPYSNTTTH